MQNVNLYRPEFRPNTDLVTAKNSAIVFALMMVFLFGNLFFDLSRAASLEAKVEELEAKSAELKKEVEAVKKLPKPKKNQKFDLQVWHARQALDNRKGLLKVINSEYFGNKEGFSQQCRALGEHLPKGLALQFFAFHNGASDIALKGETLKAENIPNYVNALKQESSFKQANFGQLKLNRLGAKILFELSGDEVLEAEDLGESMGLAQP